MFGLYSTLPSRYDDGDLQLQKPTLLKGPNYYDSPEGTDPIGKLWGVNKYAVVTGIATTSYDCLAISHAQNIREVANVAGFWFAPLIGCATAFASVTYMATDIRKKDDKINYVLGALACGPILHAWRKNFEFTCWATAILMISAWLKKDSIQNDWQFVGKLDKKYGNYFDTYDTTIITEEWPKRPY
ncbi:uncharacterized protein ND-B14.7 [Chelonus insularis]|uniref:uncharacterized protein ND-B14.7 n=1 Tax=Chelonus insularis TaxID=460826 RepID=UPI00158ED436|nr:uncharacterized protein LOC118067523 [Chelonus insularis]